MDGASERRCLAVDLGKTNCRLRFTPRGSAGDLRGPGFPGFAAADSVGLALAAIEPLVGLIDADELAQVVGLGMGAAGTDSARGAAREAAVLAKQRWGFTVAIASDVLTAHIGAFGGGDGTVLIAGTGAVAFRVDSRGNSARADGWGPWLGDEGSGRWIGQRALISALRAADGRGPRTSLEEVVREMAGDLRDVPRLIAGGADVARSLASFAPTALAHAAQGDRVACEIVDEAVDRLAATASALAEDGSPVSVVGGLTEDPAFLRQLLGALEDRGLTLHRPLGTSLDGAATLAARSDLPHERYAIRV